MKISNKAIVSSIGCLAIGLVAILLHSASCLWALFLLVLLIEEISD